MAPATFPTRKAVTILGTTYKNQIGEIEEDFLDALSLQLNGVKVDEMLLSREPALLSTRLRSTTVSRRDLSTTFLHFLGWYWAIPQNQELSKVTRDMFTRRLPVNYRYINLLLKIDHRLSDDEFFAFVEPLTQRGLMDHDERFEAAFSVWLWATHLKRVPVQENIQTGIIAGS